MQRFTILTLTLLAACHLVPKKPAPLGPEPAPLPTPPEVVPVHGLGETPVPPVETPSALLAGFTRGINLGNALDAPREGAWGVTLEEKHFEMAKAAGLDHIRLPVRFNSHAKNEAPYTIEDSFFKRV